jgi:hypothetical protein
LLTLGLDNLSDVEEVSLANLDERLKGMFGNKCTEGDCGDYNPLSFNFE